MDNLEDDLKQIEQTENINKKKKNKNKKNIIIVEEVEEVEEIKEIKEIKEVKADGKKKKSTNNKIKAVAEIAIEVKEELVDPTYKEISYNNIKLKLYNDDCVKKLEEIADESIDCIITDPPYFIDKLDNKWSATEIKDDKKNSHITHLPKGMKFDKEQVKNLYEFYLKISKILIKKIKPGGYYLSFSSPRLYHSIAMACEIAGFEVRDMINWVYTQSMPKGMSVNHVIDKLKKTKEEKEQIKKDYENFKTPMIRSCFEPICVAMKPIKTTFIINELNFKTGLIDFSNKVGEKNDKVPANIITTEHINPSYDSNFLVSKPNAKEKGDFNTHITVKPIALIDQLVKIFSKEKSIVLDPFMGSGTTGVSCKNLNRNFIGIELNKDYYDICIKRINM